MKVLQAKYFKNIPFSEDGADVGIHAFIDGKESSVPITTDNYHYREIMRQVDAGELTIEPADE